MLLPIVKQQPTYIKDTSEFIRKIEELPVNENCTLVTFGATSMYTNMRIDELIQATDRALPDMVTGTGLCDCPKHYILQLLEILLKNNHFTFAGKTYTNHRDKHGGHPFPRNSRYQDVRNPQSHSHLFPKEQSNSDFFQIQRWWLYGLGMPRCQYHQRLLLSGELPTWPNEIHLWLSKHWSNLSWYYSL